MKALAAVVTPLVLTLIVLFVSGLVLARAGYRRFGMLAILTVLALAFCATPIIASLAGLTLERVYPARPIADLPDADVAIVLGGGSLLPQEPRLEVELAAAGNRIVYAARLYRSGKVKKVMISGGTLAFRGVGTPEAEGIRSLLIEFGVTERDIIMEGQSRTTRENAIYSAQLWQLHQFRSGLLVTSAIHMPRAMYLFKAAGLALTPATTNVKVTYPLVDSPLELLPDARALADFGDVLHEWQGLLGAWIASGFGPHPIVAAN